MSTIATVSHDLHRKRRAAWNPVFSKQRILRLQPVIQERVDALLARIEDCGEKGEIINLKHGFAAYAAGMNFPTPFLVCPINVVLLTSFLI